MKEIKSIYRELLSKVFHENESRLRNNLQLLSEEVDNQFLIDAAFDLEIEDFEDDEKWISKNLGDPHFLRDAEAGIYHDEIDYK